MNWQLAAHRLGISVALAGAAVAFSQPAQAQSKKIERTLAGVRLNSASRLILAKFGNPNEIYLGDIGARLPGQGQGGSAAGDAPSMGGPMGGGASMGSSAMAGRMGGGPMGGAPMMGAPMGGGMGSSGMAGRMGGGPMMGGAPMGSSGMGSSGMMGGRPMGGAPMMGAPMGGQVGGKGGDDGEGMMGGGRPMGGRGMGSSGMMGMGGPGGGSSGMMGGGGGGGVSGFGNTLSTAARQQEVTWVYNRMVKDAKGQNTAVSYEFLINPSGAVSQIRTLGYQSPLKPTTGTPGIVTERGIRLNSSYADVLRVYGQPEGYEKVGNVLVLSYPKRHIQFQLINQKEQADPVKAAYRVIAITIATIEG